MAIYRTCDKCGSKCDQVFQMGVENPAEKPKKSLTIFGELAGDSAIDTFDLCRECAMLILIYMKQNKLKGVRA